MKILVLSTWFPYPLSQGSKIRAYYLIKTLAEKNDVYLCSFEDLPISQEHLNHMKQICTQVYVVRRNPFHYSRTGRLLGAFSLKPSSVVAGYSQEMARKVSNIVKLTNPDVAFALTFVTAPYILKLKNNIRKVVDIDNYLSQYFLEELQKSISIIQRGRRWLTWWKFDRFENQLLQQTNLAFTVSEIDRRRMLSRYHIPEQQVVVIPNGVDTTKNIPGRSPQIPGKLIFNGSITYRANYDALLYFLNEIFPLIKNKYPGACLHVTGRVDGVDLGKLPFSDSVQYTGYLEDVSPSVASSLVCVVPLRMGAGTRLKILEAAALGTPIVTTSKGAEGLNLTAGKEILIADTPQDFADQVVRLLFDPKLRQLITSNALAKVKNEYDWKSIGSKLCSVMDGLVM